MTHKMFIHSGDNGGATRSSSPKTLPLENCYETSFIHIAPRCSNGLVRMYEQWQRKRHPRESKHINLRGHSAHERCVWHGRALWSSVRTALHAAISSPARTRFNTPFGLLRNLVTGLFVVASPVFADNQPIDPGNPPTAALAAHAFDAGCMGTVPALIQGQAAIFQNAFFFGPSETDADASYTSSDGAITVAINGSPVSTTCVMTINADVGGDGADLYDGVVVHLVERLGAEPEADYTDGGVVWTWQERSFSYILSYTEVDGAFSLALLAESGAS